MTHYAAKSEFQDCVKKQALKVKGIYCMIDHQADVSINNVVMFVKLLSVFVIDGKDQVLRNVAKHEILQHLRAFENEFRQYFPIGDDDVDEYQDEFLKLKNDSIASDMLEEKSVI
ncbi:hypothetical protein T12_6789 [Trichinella patagoniensis]|uniref:Uncharacterized protein n=1 Tax=Trichinella patagoniensis TaxID=990121 RepID=A0A0V0Z890_9BILA|nr:hypothetical protein T12_6789 [Trichinella patagoniensis]